MSSLGSPELILLALLVVIPFHKIFSKTGRSGWWALLMLVPLVNVVALYYLAYSDWPVLKELQTLRQTRV